MLIPKLNGNGALTVSTRTGDKKPSYELLAHKESGRVPIKAKQAAKK